MKTKQIFTLLAVAMLHLLTGNAQTAPTAGTSQVNAPSSLSPAAAEVVKLAKSGMGNDVVLSFIGQSQSYYNLSAADVTGLKDVGVSSQAMTAMLNHDSALRAQQPPSSPAAAISASPQTTVTQSAAVVPPAIATTAPANTTVVVQATPPPPQVEVIPGGPAPDYVWTPGYWSWNGGAWIWFGGSWGYPSRPGHVWIGGYYGGHGRGRYWVGGHWR